MTFIRQYATTAALLLALAGLSAGLWQTSKALTRTQGQVSTLEAQLGALAARTARIQTQVTQAAKAAQEATHALDQAIRQDQADADQPTPPAVVDSLCRHLRCPD